jgi:hypothetical protein
VAREAFPSISTDGVKLAYSAEQAGASHIWIMDLPSRSKRMLTSSAAWDFRPAISMDGTQVAYSSGNPAASSELYRIQAAGGTAEKIGETGPIIWDRSADGRDLLTLSQTTPIGVDLIDVSTKRVIPFVRRPHNVFQAHISHDGHWAIAQEAGGVGVLIARFDVSQPAKLNWRPLGLKGADLVRWSPDDNVIYFLSNRDSFRCICGQNLDARSKQLRGEPFPVAHFHEARHSLRVFDSGEIGLAVARDKIVIAEAETVGNVWTTRLPQ